MNRVHYLTVVSIGCSILSYMLVIIFLKNQINASEITLKFLYKVIFMTIISWMPIHLVKIAIKRFTPTEEEKIMHGAKHPEELPQHLEFDNLV